MRKRIILITPQGHRVDPVRFKEYGIVVCLMKPVEHSGLYEAICAAFREPCIRKARKHLDTQQSLRKNREKINILLAEDHPLNRKLAVKCYARWGTK